MTKHEATLEVHMAMHMLITDLELRGQSTTGFKNVLLAAMSDLRIDPTQEPETACRGCAECFCMEDKKL